MPPIVARLAVDGSTGKNNPSRFSTRLSSSSTMPGCTRARRAAASSETIERRCLLTSTIRPWLTVWPHCEVPPPRGVTGTPCSRAIAIVASTSRSVRGTTTPSGMIW